MPVSGYSSQAIAISANERPIYPRTVFNWVVPLKTEVCPMIITTQVPQLVGSGGGNGALIHGMEVQSLGANSETSIQLYTQPFNDGGYTTTPSVNLRYYPLTQQAIPATDSSTNVALTLFPILPTGNVGLHLAPNETLYVALSNEIEEGIVLRVRGGWY
jgi:hypothetical protein